MEPGSIQVAAPRVDRVARSCAQGARLTPVRYRFDVFVVDTSSYSLSKADRVLSVRPKVFDILRYLIEHRDRVVAKQELLEALWRDQVVDEFSVPWTVSHLRRVLGQARGAQSPVQTVHSRGYRFVADVVELGSDPPPPVLDSQSSRPLQGRPFVGRDQVMTQLLGRLELAKRGVGGCCLVVGEAGVGKTRCLEELAARASAAGFSVWSGRCVDATFRPVFWPWIQVLREVAEEHPSLAADASQAIARMTPTSGLSEVDADQRVASLAPGLDRFGLYDTVTRLLQAASNIRPAMVAFDDLHWADAGTWELVRFAASELAKRSLMMVCARRDERGTGRRGRRTPPIRDAELVRLLPFSMGEVAHYVQELTGGERPSPALCEALHNLSQGNPWLLGEIARSLISDHGLKALPTLDASFVRPGGTVAEQVRQRLAELDAPHRAVLELASVLGDRFEIDFLALCGGLPMEPVLDALEAAHFEGFISLDPPRNARFTHGLWRQTLYDALGVAERLAHHHRVAVELERSLDPQRYGEVAYHYHAALTVAEPARAAQAARRAADAAARARAFADAALFLEWVADAQQNDATVSARERAELTLARARMERLSGRDGQARACATSLIESARAHGYVDLMLSAARVLRPSLLLGPMADPLACSALEDVLGRCSQENSEERVSALSLLSWIPPYAYDMQRSKTLSAEALQLARQLGSTSALREALHASLYSLSGPDDIEALLRAADELLALPGPHPPWMRIEALVASYRAHLYRCDLVRADVALSALGREASEQGHAEALWHHDFFHAQRVFASGDFPTSESLFGDLAARGARLNLFQAPMLDAIARSLLSYETAGPAVLAQRPELDAMLMGLLALPPCYAVTGGRLAAELGRERLARQLLYQLSTDDFSGVVRDVGYVNALTNLSETAIALGERAHAATIYELLSPYRHHNTPSGAAGFFEGAAARFLGGLAGFLDQPTCAKRHFDDAVALNEQMGALPQLAHTCYDYARWLLRDHRRSASAASLKLRAVEIADRLGMRAVATMARQL